MNKKMILFSIFLNANLAFASLLWNIDYGILEFQKNNLKNSKEYFLSYLNSNPNDENAYFWLGKVNNKLGNSEEARKNFEKAYKMSFQKKEIVNINFNSDYIENAEDYFDMAVQYYGNGNYSEANFYADMMLKLNPKSASAYFIKAKIAKTLKNEKEAKEYLEQAIIFNNDILKTNLAKSLGLVKVPNTTKEVYKYCAIEAYYKGEIEEAIINAKKYFEITKDIDMANFLADLYIKNKNQEKAKEIINEIKLLKQPNIQTYILEASVLNDKKQIEKVLLEGYKINPNNQDILLSLGNFYLKQEDFLSAKKYFETLTMINTELYEAYFGYVYSSLKLDETEKMLNIIRKMSSMQEKSSEILFLLALVCENNKSYIEALDYLEKALEKEKNPNYYFEIAKINYILKDYEKSLNNLYLAKENPENLLDMEKLEEYLIKNYIKLNKPKEAYNIISSSSTLDKNRILYKYNLYNICKMSGGIYDNCNVKFKLQKPIFEKDFLDVSEIIYEKKNAKEALKIISDGLLKYPNSSELLFSRHKFEYLILN